MDTVATYKRNFLIVAPVVAAAAVLLGSGEPAHAVEEMAVVGSTYEPSPIDMSVIYQQLGVVAACGAVFTYYWNVIVPTKRTELAQDKRNGALGEYLEELREEDQSVDGSLVSGERKVERWLLNDWMDPKTSKKAAALPLLPKSKFNSGDNPILAATAGIMAVGVVFSLLGV